MQHQEQSTINQTEGTGETPEHAAQNNKDRINKQNKMEKMVESTNSSPIPHPKIKLNK